MKREEEATYSPLSLFHVHTLLIYGEGRKKALARVQIEIKQLVMEESHSLPKARTASENLQNPALIDLCFTDLYSGDM